MKQDCQKFQADLTDAARGEEKYIKDPAALVNHLKECETCRNKFWELKEFFAGTRQAEYQPSPEFTKRMEELKAMFRKGPPAEEKMTEERRKMKEGIELYQKQKWFEAAKVFEELVKKEPAHADGWYHLGLTHQRMNLLSDALTDFNKAIELDKDDADSFYHRAEIRYRLFIWNLGGSLQEVLADLARAIHLNPDYTEAYFGRGTIYIYLKSYELARTDFQRVTELVPNESAAYHNIGITYALEGRYKEAIKEFQRALKLNPKHVLSREVLNLARAGAQAGRQKMKSKPIARGEKEIAKYKVRVKELEAENKVLRETQRQLMETLARIHYEPTQPKETGLHDWTPGQAGFSYPLSFGRGTEGRAVLPKDINFPRG